MKDFTQFLEGKTFAANRKPFSTDEKKETFRTNVKNHLKSMMVKTKQVGNDLELHLLGDKIGQVMFRNEYVAIQKEDNKKTIKYKYNELGKIKKELTSLYKKVNESIGDIRGRNVDVDVSGIMTGGKRKIHTNPDRRQQYFYDYYTGKRIQGIPKYELSQKVFEMAQRGDEMGILAQFCLQVERDSMAHDYNLSDIIDQRKN